MSDVTNPGSVNVADQADGLVSVDQTISSVSPSSNAGPTSQGLTFADGPTLIDQEILVTPSTNSGSLTQGANLAPGQGVAAMLPSTRSEPMTAQNTIEGGTFSPVSPNTISTTENTVVGQIYGNNQVQNVFV